MYSSPDWLYIFRELFSALSASAAIISVVLGAGAAFGTYRRSRMDPAKAEAGITEADISRFKNAGVAESKPFEITALAKYYNQVLTRANISFWFSVIFASIGFGVIIFAFLSHSTADTTGTIIQVTSGAIIDAVSGLFFVQSTSAQKSMGIFFEKLRLDRLNAEAREMIPEVEHAERRDQLRAQLILKYAAIDRLIVDK